MIRRAIGRLAGPILVLMITISIGFVLAVAFRSANP